MSFLNFACQFVFFVYGTLGPAYHTYKTLNNGEDEFLAWAKYWIVYAFLVTIELLTDTCLSWMTVYMPVKLILILWIVLTAPTANVWMYDAIVNPLLAKRQEQIDQFLNRGKYKVLNDAFNAMSLMCVQGRTCMLPLISQFWSGSNLVHGASRNVENLAGETETENAPESDVSSASVQTSCRIIASRSSPATSSMHVYDQSNDVQEQQPLQQHESFLHSDRSLSHLTETLSSLETSPILRRHVPRRGKQSRMQKAAANYPSQDNLTTLKNSYDDVEGLLANSRIEPDGQDVLQHRQFPSLNRL